MHKNALALTRNQLYDAVQLLITSKMIDDVKLNDVKLMSWVQLFYIALRHSDDFQKGVSPQLKKISLTEAEYHERFIRVQTLMVYFREHPPFEYHVSIVRDLINFMYRDKIPSATISERRAELDSYLLKYLANLAGLIKTLVDDQSKLEKYLKSERRFLCDTLDPNFDEGDFETKAYKDYQSELDTFRILGQRKHIGAYIASYLFADDPEIAMVYFHEDLGVPLVANFFPSYMIKYFLLHNLNYYVSGTFTGTVYQNEGKGKQRAIDDDPSVIFSRMVLSHKFNQGPIVSRDIFSPFPNRVPHAGFGSLNDPSLFAPATGSSGKTQASSPSKDLTPGQPTTIPDDSHYVPDQCLAFKARATVKLFQAMDPFPEYFDHMTRFTTTVEEPRVIFKSQVTNRDLRVFKGMSQLDGVMIMTFTRKSRKPIFNPVV